MEERQEHTNTLIARIQELEAEVSALKSGIQTRSDQRVGDVNWTNYFSLVFDHMNQGCALHEIITNDVGEVVDYRFLAVNKAFEKLTGFSAETVIGHTTAEVMPGNEQYWIEAFGRVALKGESAHFENFSSVINKHFDTWVYCPHPGYFVAIFSDITETKSKEQLLQLNEMRLKALLKLNEMSDSEQKAIADFALEEAVRLTQSSIGYLAFVNDDETMLEMFSWSQTAMAQCRMQNPPKLYKVSETGLWGEAVRQRKVIITNNYQEPNIYKKGIPEGHVPLTRHLNLPVFDKGQIVLVAGVGNKSEAYEESDINQLNLLMQGLWRIIRRQRWEIKLKQSEEKFRNLVETTNDFIWETNAEGVYVYASPHVRDLLGYEPDEVIGRSPFHFMSPNEAERVRIISESITKSGKAFEKLENTCLKRDGSMVILETSGVPMLDENGKQCGYRGIDRDITDAKQTQMALIASQERYKTIIEHAADAILFGSHAGMMIGCNEKAIQLTAYSREELLGMNIAEIFTTDSINAVPLRFDLLDQGHVVRSERIILTKDKRKIPIEMNTRRMFDGTYQTIIRDVSERIQAEEIKSSMIRNQIENMVKSQFIANLNHEIRNPLNAIVGLGNELSRSELNEVQKKYVDDMQLSSAKLMLILNDLLDYTNLESQLVKINHSVFDPSALIKEITNDFYGKAEAKQLQLRYLPHEALPALISADKKKIKRIIINLLDNAIKFTEKGEIAISGEMVSDEKKRQLLKITVRDSGIGIRKEDFDKVFQSFTQIDSSTTKEFSGTGLGLAICKNYAELLAGNITFDSAFGKGSVFTVEIPVNMEVDASTSNNQESEKNAAVKDVKVKVMVVEDDVINRMYLVNFIKSLGHTVVSAANGIKAVEEYKQELPQLIMMDCQMPVMDGFGASNAIREYEQSNALSPTYIIAITGYGIKDIEESFNKARMSDYLIKPIDEEMLVEKISSFIKKM